MNKVCYGKRCKYWRITQTTFTQGDIADDLKCTRAYVSKFESGKADNVDILVWYIEHGMPLNVLLNEDLHSDDHVACFVGERNTGKRHFEDRMDMRYKL